jgi:hypothetical protein
LLYKDYASHIPNNLLTTCCTFSKTLDTPDQAKRPHTNREPMQVVTKLLLLAMFAFAASYLPAPDGMKPHEAGNVYAMDARRLLSRCETCSARMSG